MASRNSLAPECTAEMTGTATVTVNPLPIVTLNSDQVGNEFCAGTNVKFTAGGADEYAFYLSSVDPSNLLQARSTNNEYESALLTDGQQIVVEGFDTSTSVNTQCSATASVTVAVNEHPSAAPTQDPVCDGGNLQLYANPSGGTSYNFV